MGTRDIALPLLGAAGISVDGDRPWDLQVHDDRLWDRLVRDRELGLAEAYMDGWWDAPAVDQFLAKVVAAQLKERVKISPKLVAAIAPAVLFNRQGLSRAAKNAGHHYNIGNDLYSRMLGKRMVYSCAYWRDTDDLDTAQEAKLDLICRKLSLEPGLRVLDIGCGWGGLSEFAASRYQVEVVGISPAIEQVKVARQRCAGLDVDIRQQDYRQVRGRFDRIVSVGMIEHVGPKNLATFFSACDDLLEPDGLMLHHTIGSNRSKQHTDAFFDKYIFPGGVVPSLAQLSRSSEKTWLMEDVHNFGPDYDRTLMAWHINIEEQWGELPAYDERFRRMWRYYLLASAASFRVRNLQLWQIVFRRPQRPSPTYLSPR